ncbi:MAG TPA: RNA polymerase sigma factor [Candidatus Magasanikbacteria bacterium]|nr:RNA polymerase sigma factor [Candidatus Magasanikbacteria bacterium]
MTIQEELSLVENAKAGSKNAVSLLWDDITPKLYGYLMNTLHDKTLADDILQETWLKAISSLNKFQPKGVKFSSWLFAIARNECRQYWRKNGKTVILEEDNSMEKTPDTFIVKENLNDKILVDEILKKLPEIDQEILRLHYISEFSFKEIAQILNISPLNARLRSFRALSKARAIL